MLAKSLGEMTFFCTIEKKIPAWFSQDARTGVWIMMALGLAGEGSRRAQGRAQCRRPRSSEPVRGGTCVMRRLAVAGQVRPDVGPGCRGPVPLPPLFSWSFVVSM